MVEPITGCTDQDLKEKLMIHCEKCSGLCCVALYCMKTDGFPADKEAGIPCKHLNPDFRCEIHPLLASKQMKGCIAYDCFGAGQKVTQKCAPGMDWTSGSDKADKIFQAFLIIFQLHQMEWYLLESLSLISDSSLMSDIKALISENEQMTSQKMDTILQLNVEKYKERVNRILKQVSSMISVHSSGKHERKHLFGKNFKHANLNGQDFSMALLIAANLEGCSLQGTNFLGADLRDACIKNTDLSGSIFLTQMQINSANGNSNTKLPIFLSRPAAWQERAETDA